MIYLNQKLTGIHQRIHSWYNCCVWLDSCDGAADFITNSWRYDMRKHITSVLALTLSLSSAAVLANKTSFDDIDRDRDGYVTKSDFQQHVADRHFMQFDRNRDGMLDENEFSSSRLGSNMAEFDRDRDSRLSKAEMMDGLFNQYDADRDGRLSKDEWKNVERTGIGY
jgi:hypothetical protein